MSEAEEERARIALLSSLHRPLEEHWASTPKLGLDAKGSDYTYKHHITRLEEIYTSRKLDPTINVEAPLGTINISPVTQLYGIKG